MQNIDKCKKLNSCLCCGNAVLTKILDLNNQPLANSYPKSIDEVEEFFPLALNWCNNCTHLQLTHAVHPDLLFKNYLYVSGTTKTLCDYFDSFVKIVRSYFSSNDKLRVLDIACNDGSQLNSFKNAGHETYGIDPAQNLHALSSVNHVVVCDYFNEDSINKLGVEKLDVIIAQNVLAHNTYPKEFLSICSKHLDDSGKIFIQTSQADMVKYGQFDTIYHEHISFFNTNSIVSLLNGTGLYLTDVLTTPVHGTSYVFVLSKNSLDDKSASLIKNDYQVNNANVVNFALSAKLVVIELLNILHNYPDHTIIGYGAAAKGNTLLNFAKIKLDYIVDDNPLKHNLYTPGTKIKIVSLDDVHNLCGSKPILWVPLSWNFFDEIKGKVKSKFPQKQTFIKYFPILQVIVE